MNLRPSGYEPDELPDCSTPRRGVTTYHLVAWSKISARWRRQPEWAEEEGEVVEVVVEEVVVVVVVDGVVLPVSCWTSSR